MDIWPGGIFALKFNCGIATEEVMVVYIRVRGDFFDKKDSLRLRKKGEVMEVDEERGKHLISLHLADETEAPAQTPKKQTDL